MRCTVPSEAFAWTGKVPARLLPAAERAALFFFFVMSRVTTARTARRVHDCRRCICCRGDVGGESFKAGGMAVALQCVLCVRAPPAGGTTRRLLRPHELIVSFRIRQTVCPEGGKRKKMHPREEKKRARSFSLSSSSLLSGGRRLFST